MNLAIINNIIPHYRTEFFQKISKRISNLRLYTMGLREQEMKEELPSVHLSNINIKDVVVYNPFAFNGIDAIVTQWHFAHLSTWFLLLTKFVHRKKIFLWGHGLSVKRYLKEFVKPDWKLKLMLFLADGAWIYCSKEADIWKRIYPNKSIAVLGNTISGIDKILSYQLPCDKLDLRKKYNISQEFCFIFCARFNNEFRRIDLLLEIIHRLDSNKYAFIIIGDGPSKPDFSQFSNVHEFGTLYDINIKQELFSISDAYIQPGWVGLSIVEAMGYGLPVLTFKRSEETKQCVEYGYLTDKFNSLIFTDIDNCLQTIESLKQDDYILLSQNARNFVSDNLKMDNMVDNALCVFGV